LARLAESLGVINVDTTKELPAVIAFCAGYGGIERGLELAGVEHRVIAYVEIEAFVIANLVKKMETGQLPPAPIYTDIKTFPAHLFRDRVDLITGGYPCQPFSSAGQRKGEDDPRHLWPFIRRHIESIRPVRVFFENVEGHISLGLSSVISDLEDDGYRATFGIFSASEVGAPHQRKRVYIMGDSKGLQCNGNSDYGENFNGKISKFRNSGSSELDLANSNSVRLEEHGYFKPANFVKASQNVADSDSAFGKGGRIPSRVHKEYSITNGSSYAVGTKAPQQWLSEPRVGRVVDGCSDRVDRLRLLGNGVVPQTAAKAWMILNERFKQNSGGSND